MPITPNNVWFTILMTTQVLLEKFAYATNRTNAPPEIKSGACKQISVGSKKQKKRFFPDFEKYQMEMVSCFYNSQSEMVGMVFMLSLGNILAKIKNRMKPQSGGRQRKPKKRCGA